MEPNFGSIYYSTYSDNGLILFANALQLLATLYSSTNESGTYIIALFRQSLFS